MGFEPWVLSYLFVYIDLHTAGIRDVFLQVGLFCLTVDLLSYLTM